VGLLYLLTPDINTWLFEVWELYSCGFWCLLKVNNTIFNPPKNNISENDGWFITDDNITKLLGRVEKSNFTCDNDRIKISSLFSGGIIKTFLRVDVHVY
jgi:hypothetical protein